LLTLTEFTNASVKFLVFQQKLVVSFIDARVQCVDYEKCGLPTDQDDNRVSHVCPPLNIHEVSETEKVVIDEHRADFLANYHALVAFVFVRLKVNDPHHHEQTRKVKQENRE